MSLTTPHMVSLGMFSYWPTALHKTTHADTERVSVPDTLYQRVVQQDRREERAFGFIRESYRAWRLTGLEARKTAAPRPIKMEAPAPTMPTMSTMPVAPMAPVAPVVAVDGTTPSAVADTAATAALFHGVPGRDMAVDPTPYGTPVTCYEPMVPSMSLGYVIESPPTTADVDAAGGPPAPTKKRKFRKCGTSDATKVLRDWLFDPQNQEHPYPSEKEKKVLSEESGLTIKQIGIWFRNARQRLCTPTPVKSTTIQPEQAAHFMHLISLRQDDATPLRRGAWSADENQYAQRLIQLFTQGHLPVMEGTPLRSFLSLALHCHTMRISKKFVRDSSVGKITFRRDRIFNAHGGVFDNIVCELLALKTRVLESRGPSADLTKPPADDAAFQVQAWIRSDGHRVPPLVKLEQGALPPLPQDDLEPFPTMMHDDDTMLDAFEFDLLGATFGPYEIDPTVAQMLSP